MDGGSWGGGGGGGGSGAWAPPAEGVPPAYADPYGQPDPYAGVYDIPGGPERMDEVATVVQNVDYTGADYAQSMGGYTQTKEFQETAAKVGFLWKKGGSKEKSGFSLGGKGWSRRFFVMDGTNLLYYSSMDDRSIGIPEKGKVVLNDFKIRPTGRSASGVDDGKPGTFGFALVSATRDFDLAAESEADKQDWMRFLQSVLDMVEGKVLVSDSQVERAAEHYRQGNKHLMEGQNELAVQEYTTSIGMNPAYEDAYYNRGISYLNTGINAKLAITDFSQVIKMNAGCASAYNNRGISYKQENKVELAIADYRACLKLEPSDEYAMKNLQLCEEELATMGRYVEAPLGHDYSGYMYRQTPSHYFAKRFLTIQGGMLSDTMSDSVLNGFNAAVRDITRVMPQFDEPYCSTAPECEFQVMYGRTLIRLRAPTAQARLEWIAALGGER